MVKAAKPSTWKTCADGPKEGELPTFSILHYAIAFLIIALIAAAIGFGGVGGIAMEGARLLFWVFIILFVISLIVGLIRRI